MKDVVSIFVRLFALLDPDPDPADQKSMRIRIHNTGPDKCLF